MSGGVDKLIVLSQSIEDVFRSLARKQGIRKWGYGHVLDLRQTDRKLPIILYCDGINDGRHKIEVRNPAGVTTDPETPQGSSGPSIEGADLSNRPVCRFELSVGFGSDLLYRSNSELSDIPNSHRRYDVSPADRRQIDPNLRQGATTKGSERSPSKDAGTRRESGQD